MPISNSEPDTGASSPLTPEAEAVLNSVSGTIGEETPGGETPEMNAEGVAALMSMVVFHEKEIKAALTAAFGFMERFREVPTWALSDAEAEALAPSYTTLANSAWAKLKGYLPTAFGSFCETTPGAVGAILATVAVVFPKVLCDIEYSKRKKAGLIPAPKKPVTPAAPPVVPTEQEPAAGTWIVEDGEKEAA